MDGASTGGAVRAGAARAEVATCTAKAPDVAGVALTTLRYQAVGSYEGKRVVALAYDRADSSLRILLLIDVKGCEVVTEEDF